MPNLCHCSIPRFKQRVVFITGQYGNLYNIMDVAKVADSLLLLVSAEEEIDDFGEGCISCLLGQGMPAVTIVTQVHNQYLSDIHRKYTCIRRHFNS